MESGSEGRSSLSLTRTRACLPSAATESLAVGPFPEAACRCLPTCWSGCASEHSSDCEAKPNGNREPKPGNVPLASASALQIPVSRWML